VNIVTHVAVGIALSQFFPSGYLPASVAFSVMPDLDHLPSAARWKLQVNGFETSQTFMHGLFGATIYGTAGLLMTLLHRQTGSLFLLCVAVHLFLDFISGVSIPFRLIYADPTRINFGNPADQPLGRKFWIRFIQEAGVIGASLLISVA